jgi:hypothetical protein
MEEAVSSVLSHPLSSSVSGWWFELNWDETLGQGKNGIRLGLKISRDQAGFFSEYLGNEPLHRKNTRPSSGSKEPRHEADSFPTQVLTTICYKAAIAA